MSDQKDFDLIALGRAGVDLYSEQIHGRLEDVTTFKKYVGGSPCNVAIGCARLQLKTGMITSVGDDAMGRFIVETLRKEGVNTDYILSNPDKLTAMVLLGIESDTTFPLMFYRENCADMHIQDKQIPINYIKNAKALLLSGTHLCQAHSFSICAQAAKRANDSRTQVILDIDYRPTLWGLTAKGDGQTRFKASSEVSETIQAILPSVDLIVGTEEEIHIAGGATNTPQALKNIRQVSDATIVLKLGAQGASCYLEDLSKPIHHAGFKVEVMNVLGAGDAFLSGFLKGWLNRKPIGQCLKLGNACGALVVSRHGCSPAMPTQTELDLYLSMPTPPFKPDQDPMLKQAHWSTTQPKFKRPLMIHLIDEIQSLDKAKSKSTDLTLLAQAKRFIAQAMLHVDFPQACIGLVLDDHHCAAIIPELTQRIDWLGRSVEVPGEKPICFESELYLTSILRTWPAPQVIKCAMNYHPDDRYTQRQEQESQLMRLFIACRESGHRLILRLEVDTNQSVTPKTFAQIISRIYDIGVFPDWWIIPPQKESSWQHIESAIDTHDVLCHGILLHSEQATLEQLKSAIDQAKACQYFSGLALSHGLYAGALKQWSQQKIDNQQLIEHIVETFMQVSKLLTPIQASNLIHS